MTRKSLARPSSTSYSSRCQSSPALLSRKQTAVILDYIEVGHYEAALDMLEAAITGGKQPGETLVLSLVNILLETPQLTNKHTSASVRLCMHAYRLLKYTTSIGGPWMFDPVWLAFGDCKRQIQLQQLSLRNKKKVKDNDDIEDFCSCLETYDTMWDLAKACFSEPIHPVHAKYTNSVLDNNQGTFVKSIALQLMLDLCISVLEDDVRLHQSSSSGDVDIQNTIATSLFRTVVQEAGPGQSRRLEQSVDIIHCALNAPYIDRRWSQQGNTNLALRLLNLLITTHSHDSVSSQGLLNHVYHMFVNLDGDKCIGVLRGIHASNPSFTRDLCSLAIANSDISRANITYAAFLRICRIGINLQNWICHAFNAYPRPLDSIQDVYRHVVYIAWLYMSQMDCRSTTVNRRITRSCYQVDKTVQNYFDDWKQKILQWISAVKGDSETEDKIWWTVEMAELSTDGLFQTYS